MNGKTVGVIALLLLRFSTTSLLSGQWVARDERRSTQEPQMWALYRELPELYREVNGIDFGHAHRAEILLRTHNRA